MWGQQGTEIKIIRKIDDLGRIVISVENGAVILTKA